MTAMRLASSIGRRSVDLVGLAGRSVIFLAESLSCGWLPPLRLKRIGDQIAFIGAKSVPIILLTGLFTGMVLGLQVYHNLGKFGSSGLLGSVVALSIIRELGPVLSALMVAGRAGSSITAEIGIMRITEQMSALEMMAVNPVKYVITPKLYASLVAMPILTVFFNLAGILGGYVVGVWWLGVDGHAFFSETARSVALSDIMGGLLKSVVFGLAVSWACCLIGYTAVPTTEGVTRATTRAVVVSSVAVLVLDYLLTSLLL
jgi:phospholipid/cholesterol/gamma-HCH transport system permease protein